MQLSIHSHSTVSHMGPMNQSPKRIATSKEDGVTKTPVHQGSQERQVSGLTTEAESNRQLPFSEGNSVRPIYGSFRVPRQKRQPPSPHQFNSGQWDEEEQRAFLHGIVCFGWGRWKEIGTLVPSRSNCQIKSYGQKMAAKQQSGENIFEILKEPAPVPKQLPNEVGDVLSAARGLFAFKSRADPPLDGTPQPDVTRSNTPA